ncbi:hypothetical protein F5148DRAFT_263313 [Russula earlei]|uniref:Uncharacterized protein n=1 Tax=Russula earlei TaxID=71964 RepID=A0ACC0ULG1_9AGAM|nr:hypothetical protein F5148DRAFT_263313 [Russula earlei]
MIISEYCQVRARVHSKPRSSLRITYAFVWIACLSILLEWEKAWPRAVLHLGIIVSSLVLSSPPTIWHLEYSQLIYTILCYTITTWPHPCLPHGG